MAVEAQERIFSPIGRDQFNEEMGQVMGIYPGTEKAEKLATFIGDVAEEYEREIAEIDDPNIKKIAESSQNAANLARRMVSELGKSGPDPRVFIRTTTPILLKAAQLTEVDAPEKLAYSIDGLRNTIQLIQSYGAEGAGSSQQSNYAHLDRIIERVHQPLVEAIRAVHFPYLEKQEDGSYQESEQKTPLNEILEADLEDIDEIRELPDQTSVEFYLNGFIDRICSSIDDEENDENLELRVIQVFESHLKGMGKEITGKVKFGIQEFTIFMHNVADSLQQYTRFLSGEFLDPSHRTREMIEYGLQLHRVGAEIHFSNYAFAPVDYSFEVRANKAVSAASYVNALNYYAGQLELMGEDPAKDMWLRGQMNRMIRLTSYLNIERVIAGHDAAFMVGGFGLDWNNPNQVLVQRINETEGLLREAPVAQSLSNAFQLAGGLISKVGIPQADEIYVPKNNSTSSD